MLVAIVLVAAALILEPVQAQPPTPNTGNNGGVAMGGGPGNAPIDGGIAILMTLAVSYGFRKVKLLNKKEESSN
ncbi:MAG: hypothetical protein IPH45_10670 [Bacteroidales bacterium]|nr:hypothetical protein [Bacteroidales bacterium]MBK7174173.1 hypothetical protein [Bacteroidales bacterium]